MSSSLVCFLGACAFGSVGFAQSGFLHREVRIANDAAGLIHQVDIGDRFGAACATGVDVDGDGREELLVGAPMDDDGGLDRGALYVLFLAADGRVERETKISGLEGALGAQLLDGDHFGSSVVALGDADGDGLPEIAVGAPGDDAGGTDRGAILILELLPSGVVNQTTRIRPDTGPFMGMVQAGDGFGAALGSLGDTNGDGVMDITVGAPGADGAGLDRGVIWNLRLSSFGSVLSAAMIDPGAGGFGGQLSDFDAFGSAIAGVGDLNGDGNTDLAIGAPGDDDGGPDRGAVWIILFDREGFIVEETKMSSSFGGLVGPLTDGDRFGAALSWTGGTSPAFSGDLVVGAPGNNAGGEAWVLKLGPLGLVVRELVIGEGLAGFGGLLPAGNQFGASVAVLADVDGDGSSDLAIGAPGDAVGGADRGAVWVSFTRAAGQAPNPGTGLNPDIYREGQVAPNTGNVWDPFIQTPGTEGGSRAPIVHWVGISDLSFSGTRAPGIFGELLIDLSPPHFLASFLTSPGSRFAIPIPQDSNLVGMHLFTQGAEVHPDLIQLTNGVDVVIGL